MLFWGARDYLNTISCLLFFYIKFNILKIYKPTMTTFSTGFMLGWCHLWFRSQVFCWGRIIKSKLMGWPSKQGSLSLRSTLVIVAHYLADWICRKASTCGHVGREETCCEAVLAKQEVAVLGSRFFCWKAKSYRTARATLVDGWFTHYLVELGPKQSNQTQRSRNCITAE